MADYLNPLNAALYSRLSGYAGLTSLLASGSAVYFTQAPDDATLPYVVFSYQGGPGYENQTQNDTVNEVVYVRGYAASPALAGSIHAQVKAALHRYTLSVTGWTNFWTAIERVLPALEIDDANVKTWSAGGFYRIRLDD